MSEIRHNVSRMFIASPIIGEARASLEAYYAERAAVEADYAGKIRWSVPENWHLTWLFLGSVARQEQSSIEQRLTQLGETMAPVTLELDWLACWPNENSPRVLVWRGDANPVSERADMICAQFPEFADTREFKAHVTLARFSNKSDDLHPVVLESWASPRPAKLTISELVLYESRPTEKRSVYEAVFSVPCSC